MRITIITSIVIETDRLTSSIVCNCSVLIFSGPPFHFVSRPTQAALTDTFNCLGAASAPIVSADCFKLPELCLWPFNVEEGTANVK